MTWNDVTVFQYQQLMNIYVREDVDDLETATLSILFNKTENEVLSLTQQERKEWLKQIEFVHEPPKGKPLPRIRCNNGKVYNCVYDVRQIRAGRYVEAKHFAKAPDENLHRIAASMVVPTRKVWGWRKADKYDASKHEEYANDLLTAPITSVLGSVVFFCEVYRIWMRDSKDYLVKEMITAGMTTDQAEEAYQTLWIFTDGTTRQLWSQNTSA